jgi:Transglycosylase SLT domain
MWLLISMPLRGFPVVVACLLSCSSGLHAESATEGSQGFVLPKTVSSLPLAAAVKRRPYLQTFEQQAREQGVPAELVDAVAFLESGYEPSTIGQAGEIGIMQILPSTAAMLGFSANQAQLADPETNIRYGVQYLTGALRLAGGDICRALMKYRAGHGEQVMSARSTEYCRRAREHLAALGSPLAMLMSVPVAPVAVGPIAMTKPPPRPGGNLGTRSLTPAERSRQFWAAHEARVKAITSAVRAKWARLALQKRG